MVYYLLQVCHNIVNRNGRATVFTPFLMTMVINICVKSVRIQSYSGPYFPAFGLNYGPEQLLKRTIFTQWCVASDYVMRWNSYNNLILRILRILFQWDKIHGFTISVPGLKLPIFWQLLLRNEKISSKCSFWNERT